MRYSDYKIERVSFNEYKELVPDTQVFFNRPEFAELNKNKVDELYYLLSKKGESDRFGIICGRVGNELRCPFSAPYSYPVEIKKHMKIDSYEGTLYALEEFCKTNGIEKIRFVFPPFFYNEHGLSAWLNIFYRKGYSVANADISYAIDLDIMDVDEETYGKMIHEKGRKGLRRAIRKNLTITHCESEEEYLEAYTIMSKGHEYKGFPVKLSYDELRDTMKIADRADAFIVRQDGVGIVAEFLYAVNDKIVQGIYTGTLPEYMDCNGMNMLTYYTIRYYSNLGYKILDKATATENSVPNYGLCDFKDSVGCKRSIKYTFVKNICNEE